MKKFKKGFTLIELLIVIALLGALAVGLLAALDPFEQLKKGTDTGVRNTVAELQGAVIRYYAIKSEMPWQTASSLTAITNNALSGYADMGITQIISAGELKSDFSALAGNKLSEISVLGTTESVTVCFKPLSKAMRNDPATKYELTNFSDYGTNNVANCGDPGAGTFHCMWCVK